MDYKVIPLTTDGEGHVLVVLGSVQVQFVTRFNYSIPAWTLDLLDANGNLLIAGLPLFPKIDIMKPHTTLKSTIGSLVVVELEAGDYKSPDLLGTQVQLLWFAPGETVVIP